MIAFSLIVLLASNDNLINRKKMKAIKLIQFFALLIALIAASLSAHADNIDEDGRIWLNINMQTALPIKGLNAYFEDQPRWREEGSEYDQTIIRPAIFYDVSPK